MSEALFGVPKMDVYLVMGILIFFIFIETIGGFLQNSKRKSGDWIQEFGGFLALSLLIKPGVVFLMMYLGGTFFSSTSGMLSGYNVWILLPAYIFIDDCLQYWYHRSAHEYEFLWKLHRTHHQAEEMGFFVSYRNAALYYVIMPNIIWVGIFTFLGGGQTVAIALVLKQLIIIGSHSRIHWDAFFYKYPVLNPLITVLERIFITPAFHHAHHGKSMKDGISDPNGNYGNMFSIWDQLFGTATFTRQFSTDLGLMNDPKEHWTAPYLYPLITSKDKTSELSRGYKKESTKTLDAISVQLEKGENYLWCQCGKSKNQPFCDGSHHGSKFKPQLFEAKKTGDFRLCNCKSTKAGPFCDDTHLSLK